MTNLRPEPGNEKPAPAVTSFVLDRLVAAEAAGLDRPHVVLCRSPLSDTLTVLGPYANGLAALTAAQRETDLEIEADPESELIYTVAELFAPW